MIEKQEFSENLKRLPTASVLCIGDVMMDRFVYGAVDRISPEAPIPVLRVEREKHMLGGSGNVVANMAALGVRATLIAAVGDDGAATDIRKNLEALNIASALEIDAARGTTVKSRFVCGTQQMLRVDREKTEEISKDVEDKIITRAGEIIPTVGAVVLSDYKKGLLTDRVISSVIALAKKHGIPVIVDPKGADFTRYKGASVITPNRRELETATGMKAGTDDDVRAAAMKLIMSCGISTVLATRSKDGLSVVTEKEAPLHIPAQVREIYDVSGAGDTVIAVFASMIAAGVDVQNAARLANIAAGIVVGKPGTATARLDEIEKALASDAPAQNKIYSKIALAEKTDLLRVQGKKIGFTNGCFDLLHPGHVSTLRQARAACDFLIVGINSDASVKKLKGPSRPVQNEAARSAILAGLEMVDAVIVFGEDTPLELLKAFKPDVLVKGGQYKLEEVVGYDVVMSYGGKILRAEMEEGFSTTNTIAKMAG
jgi:D-beta-D-heptose 7-phosphate kinase / D-beta-D-heptose 1-phosphate adenosyltransferase